MLTVETLDIGAIDRAEALHYLGHRGQEIDDALSARIDALLEEARSLVRPRAAWASFEIVGDAAVDAAAGDDAAGENPIRLAGTTLALPGRNIARHLEGARQAVVLAVTVGLALDRELRLLSAIDPAGEAILDAAGTVAVEQAADAASARIRAWAEERGLHTGARFSPGYGDLPLACQPAVLASVDAQRRLGITLADSLLMAPVKSVTAIIGVFDDQGLADRAARRSGAAS